MAFADPFTATPQIPRKPLSSLRMHVSFPTNISTQLAESSTHLQHFLWLSTCQAHHSRRYRKNAARLCCSAGLSDC